MTRISLISHSASAQHTGHRTFNSDVCFNIFMFIGVKEEDMIFLWTTCREVSRDFKDAVERVFIARHIRKTFIRFIVAGTEFHFSHIDKDDHSRAVFRGEDISEEERPKVIQRLKRFFKEGIPPHKPIVVVQIRSYPNDTWIPDMECDWDAMEARLNWRGMYSEYFREAKEQHRRTEAFVQDPTTQRELTRMRGRIDRGEVDPNECVMTGVKVYFTAHEKFKKEIRSERIAWNVQRERPDLAPWNDPESDAHGYQRLKDITFMAGFENYSDSEEEEEEDEDSEDEWTDCSDDYDSEGYTSDES